MVILMNSRFAIKPHNFISFTSQITLLQEHLFLAILQCLVMQNVMPLCLTFIDIRYHKLQFALLMDAFTTQLFETVFISMHFKALFTRFCPSIFCAFWVNVYFKGDVNSYF